MTNKDLFLKAKVDLQPVYIKKYFELDISWERIVNYLYKESIKEDNIDQKNRLSGKSGTSVVGNVIVQNPLWIQFDSSFTKVWETFPEFKDFLIKFNENCSYLLDNFFKKVQQK